VVDVAVSAGSEDKRPLLPVGEELLPRAKVKPMFEGKVAPAWQKMAPKNGLARESQIFVTT